MEICLDAKYLLTSKLISNQSKLNLNISTNIKLDWQGTNNIICAMKDST